LSELNTKWGARRDFCFFTFREQNGSNTDACPYRTTDGCALPSSSNPAKYCADSATAAHKYPGAAIIAS
jgi:hypothetical protein